MQVKVLGVGVNVRAVRRTGAAGVLACTLFVSACGADDKAVDTADTTSSSTSTSSSTTTEVDSSERDAKKIGKALASDSSGAGVLADDETNECLGASLIESLGSERALELALGGAELDPTTLTAEDSQAMADAFDECVDAETAASIFVEGMAAEMGAPMPEDMLECTTGVIDGRVGDLMTESMAMADDDEAMPPVLGELLGSCFTVGDLMAAGAAEDGEPLSEAQIACIDKETAGKVDVNAVVNEEEGAELAIAAALLACIPE